MLTKMDIVTRPPHQVWMLYMLESPLVLVRYKLDCYLQDRLNHCDSL